MRTDAVGRKCFQHLSCLSLYVLTSHQKIIAEKWLSVFSKVCLPTGALAEDATPELSGTDNGTVCQTGR